MARYKVEYEVEGTLRTQKDGSRFMAGKTGVYRVPEDAVVTELEPPFVPGYYRRRGYSIGTVSWFNARPLGVSQKDWREERVRVRVEPEED